jgi:hypothetical protein
MLPQPLIEEFWHKVQNTLQEDYGKDVRESRRAVDRYRQVVETRVGDMIFHRDAKEVAATINEALNNGVLFQDFGQVV